MNKAIQIALILAGAFVFVALVLTFYGGSNNDGLVILKADESPLKTAPDDPGGLKLNSIDSPVLSLLDKKTDDEGVEVLRPPVTEPEPPPIKIEEESSESSESSAPATEIITTEDSSESPAFVVQFAAFKNEARAKNAAAVLSSKHESRLANITLGYMKSGEYWRVVTETMPRAQATELCSMFRSVGQECIIKSAEQP